jgi:uncharacterized protein (TIGR02391 family)
LNDDDAREFVPFGTRAPSLSSDQTEVVKAAARLFIDTDTWPSGRTVMRELARGGLDWSDDWFSLPATVGSYHGSDVILTAEGLHLSGEAAELLDALVGFARTAAELYLGPEDEPRISIEVMERAVGPELARRLNRILPTESFLTGSGTASDDGWSYEIGPAAASFRGCATIPEYLRMRRKLRPAAPAATQVAPIASASVDQPGWHPAIAEVVAAPLVDGRVRDAVVEATYAVRDLLRARTGLSSDGATLVDQACTILRFFPDLDGRTPDNKRAGTKFLLDGLFRDIRNTVAHDRELIDLAEVHEIVGLCSLLARRIEAADVLAGAEGA